MFATTVGLAFRERHNSGKVNYKNKKEGVGWGAGKARKKKGHSL